MNDKYNSGSFLEMENIEKLRENIDAYIKNDTRADKRPTFLFFAIPGILKQSYIGCFAINTEIRIITAALWVKRKYPFTGVQC